MSKVETMRDPCVRVKRAMYGLPRAGFDWFAHADEVLVERLGWSRQNGVDSVYHKKNLFFALYANDIMLAGAQHDWRREWAAPRKEVKLRGNPEPLDRFLGVKYDVRQTGKHTRCVTATQEEYVRSIVKDYDKASPTPAGQRAAPAPHKRAGGDSGGDRAGDCRKFIGSLMYVVRATRPDAAYAVNKLAREVARWAKADDAGLAHVTGYLNATAGHGLL